MDIDGAADGRPARGRVVMLVDNAVNGDSRVQKTARSSAEAGWDVTLLGRSPDGDPREWRIGDALVRLLPMPEPLARRRHEFRRAWLRWPLAYPPNGIAAHRAQWVRAWQADLRLREAELDQDPNASPARRRLLRTRSLAAAATRRWVSFRHWQLTRARHGRRLDGPWDRAYTAFWQAALGDRAWRRLEPGLWDYELAYGPVVDELRPHLVHAHDFRMLGVGARAVIRARAAGRTVKLVWDAHEFLPGLRPWRNNARWLPGNCAHEREYAPYADAVVTVSDTLADMLRERHGLAERPAVVLNAPHVGVRDRPAGQPADRTGEPGLRARCGVGPDVPLLVYSGAALEQRGLAIMVEALPDLPGAHAALVVNRPDDAYVRDLLARAAELGVADRVHALPYVPHWQVCTFLAEADIGVIPIHHWPNHEIALITKFFEYAHARLPLVVSDVRTMAQSVRETGHGEVFVAGDRADFVRATRAVLADPQRYRDAYRKPGLLDAWTWQAQAEVLDGVYRRLLPAAARPEPTGAAR